VLRIILIFDWECEIEAQEAGMHMRDTTGPLGSVSLAMLMAPDA